MIEKLIPPFLFQKRRKEISSNQARNGEVFFNPYEFILCF
jgi:hypothetical protein